MKLEPHKLGLATAAAFAVIWMLCSFIFWQMPDMSMTESAYMMHSNMDNWSWKLHFGGFLGAFILWTLCGGISAWFIAVIYNKLF
ncbi:MAG: hypothetical protein ACI9J5_003191 [Paraglaciecola sp.]|jgi:hypothetical protein